MTPPGAVTKEGAIAAMDAALTYCRLALTALDLGSPSEASLILSTLIGSLVNAGAHDFMEDE